MDTERGVAHYSQINAGSRMSARTGVTPQVVVAGSGDDDAWKEGAAIDRTTGALFLSAVGAVNIVPTLNTGETVAVNRRYRHADAAIGPWTELPSLPDAEVATETITAAQMTATPGPRTFQDNLDLAGAKQFIRQDVKVNLSRANTDTCRIASSVVLAGVDHAPV